MQKDDRTWLNICLVCLVLIASLLFWKAISFATFKLLPAYTNEIWFNPLVILASVMFGIGVTYVLQHDANRGEFLLGSVTEVRRVSWPTWEVTRKLTMIVCVVVAFFSCVLFVFDGIWGRILHFLLS